MNTFLILIAALFPLLCFSQPKIIRVGHFPNVTHAQAVIAHGMARSGEGWFEKRLGEDVKVEWYVYNAGPSVMEGIFAATLDFAYVGPSPTINAFVRSEGKEIRVVAGACSGGASLVVQPDGRIQNNADFRGKTVAIPQFGSTQDIAARFWLRSLGYQVTLRGGDVKVIPTMNADQLSLFQQGTLDAVWTVEPWVSLLELEAKGKIYLQESSLWPQTDGQYVTTHLVSSVKLIENSPEIVKKWVQAHIELTDWINAHPEEARKIFNEELFSETRRKLPTEVLVRAWTRLEFTSDPLKASLYQYANEAYIIGFLKKKPDLSSLYELRFLNEMIKEQHRD